MNPKRALLPLLRLSAVALLLQSVGCAPKIYTSIQKSYPARPADANVLVYYITDTLLPYVVQWESEDSYKLPTPQDRAAGVYIHGNVEALLRADPATRFSVYEKAIQNSIMNPDECRAKEEKNPIPGGLGQHFLATKNLGSLESVLNGGEASG